MLLLFVDVLRVHGGVMTVICTYGIIASFTSFYLQIGLP